VVLYNAVLAVQSLAWILLTGAALKHHLTRDADSTVTMRGNHRNGYMALALYSVLTVMALRWPLAAAMVTSATWAFWLVLGMRMKHA
jgi:hypothetical protein